MLIPPVLLSVVVIVLVSFHCGHIVVSFALVVFLFFIAHIATVCIWAHLGARSFQVWAASLCSAMYRCSSCGVPQQVEKHWSLIGGCAW